MKCILIVYFGILATVLGEVCDENYVLTRANWGIMIQLMGNCKVIEGYLVIEQLNGTYYTLPNLTMVTDYVIINRNSEILSLNDLLPNLKVIRGRKFVGADYDKMGPISLAVNANYEMEQVGEWEVNILKGGVAIENNIMLCPGGEMFWKRRTDPIFWKTNRFGNNHPYCFEDCMFDAEAETECSGKSECPVKDKKCDDKCAGGCIGSRCMHCRHFVRNGICYEKCPKGYLEYMDYICMTHEECEGNRKTVVYEPENETQGQCVFQCPDGYESGFVNSRQSCVKINKASRCKTTVVTSANMGKNLKDCVFVNGSLTISLPERVDISEIRINLEKITIVAGYLEIIGAKQLYSIINILPSLQEISGKDIIHRGGDSFSLYVMDNQNLRELWNFKNESIKLKIVGNAYIGFNEKLCTKQADLLTKYISSNGEVFTGNNGIKAQCDIIYTELLAVPGSIEGTVHLQFEHSFTAIDDRWFWGYNIYYRKSKTDVISLFENRDPYYDKVWKPVTFIFTKVPNKKRYIYSIQDLNPKTRYAFFVESVAFDEENKAVQSNVVYATTFAKNPSGNIIEKIKVAIENNNTLALVVSTEEKGTFYEIDVEVQYTEDWLDSTEKDFAINVAERTINNNPTKHKNPANDIFTHIPDLIEIPCDKINKNKILAIRKRKKLESAILNRIYFDKNVTKIVGNRTAFRSIAAYNQKAKKKLPKKKATINVNWTQNEISFSVLKKDQHWNTNNGIFWKLTKVTSENNKNIKLKLPFDYLKYIGLDFNITLRECRNKMENCSVYLKNDTACAQCSDPFQLIYKYEGEFHISAAIYFVNETEQVIRGVRHPCSNQIGGYQTLEIRWMRDRMALGYNISVTGGTEVMNIWTNAKAAAELNYTCYVKIDSPDVVYVVSIISRRRIRSLQMGLTSIMSSDCCIDDNKTLRQIMAWCGILILVSVLAVVVIIALIRRSKNAKRSIKFNENSNYGYPRKMSQANHTTAQAEEIPEEVKKILFEGGNIISQKEIGQGHFSIVYRVKFKEWKEEVAIKELLPKINISKNEANKKAWKEILMCMSLKNDLIVKGIGLTPLSNIRNEQIFCQVFEYVEADNLEDYLKNNVDVSFNEKKLIAIQIAMALQYMANSKIVHGDIASRNILKTSSSIKICDFGLAVKLTEYCKEEDEVNLLPICSAPERWKAEIYLTTDIWSYGILLYEIYTGKSLFENVKKERVREIIEVIFNDEINIQKRVEYQDNPFRKIDKLPIDRMTKVVSECIKPYIDRPHANWIINYLANDDDNADSIESCDTVKEIESALQNENEQSDESIQSSFSMDEEEPLCLTPEEMSGGVSCISLQCISRRNVHSRFDDPLLGTSVPI